MLNTQLQAPAAPVTVVTGRRRRGLITLIAGLLVLGVALGLAIWADRRRVIDRLDTITLTIEPLAPHPLDPSVFVYEVRLEAVVPSDNDERWIDRVRTFRFEALHEDGWQAFEPRETPARVVRPAGNGTLEEVPEKSITMTEDTDPHGNAIEEPHGVEYRRAPAFFASWGARQITSSIALGVKQVRPRRLAVIGEVPAAAGGYITVRAEADVPPPAVNARPAFRVRPAKQGAK